MSLKQQLMEDMKQAMKAKDTVKLNTIRLINSEVKNIEIDEGELDDAGVQRVIKRMIKQWKDAIIDYRQGKREDLVEAAQAKIKILELYLPAEMAEEDLKKIIQEVIEGSGQGQMGPIIGLVMAKVKGQADGSTVARLVKDLLSKPA